MDLILPSQYVEFLKTYGHGGICGVCTDGIGLDGSYVFVENTLEYRAEGLQENLIVIENADEWLYHNPPDPNWKIRSRSAAHSV